jgi:hypothetical protein
MCVRALSAARCDDFSKRNDHNQEHRGGKAAVVHSPAGNVSKDWRHNEHRFLAVVSSSFAFCPSLGSVVFVSGAGPVRCLPVQRARSSQQQQILLELGDPQNDP